MNDHMSKFVSRLQCGAKFGSLDAYECEIRDEAEENVRVECQKWREAGEIKILIVVKPKRAKGHSDVYRSKSEQTQPRRPNTKPKAKSNQDRQNYQSSPEKRRKIFQEFAVEQSVEGVEMGLSPRHRAKRCYQLVFLPLSFRPDEDDFVTDEFAGAVIVFPVFRDKDFEERAGTKSHSGPGEPDQMLGEIVWDQFRVPGF
jgi:hypothetical protein